MPAKDKKIESFNRVLIVEGYSDLHFYAEMLEELGKHEQVFIKQLGGKSEFEKKLETLITPSLIEAKIAIGLIVDADDKPDQTRQSMEQLLSRLTNQKIVDGKWSEGKPRIGLLVVPGGSVDGEIETLVWNSWANDPQNKVQKKCVEGFVECMKAAKSEAKSPHKGLIGSLLAIRSDEDPRLGPGARDNVFDLSRPELDPLRSFLSGY